MPVVNGSWCCGNEPSIKIYEADEALEVVNISRLWEPPKSLEVSGSALFLEILWPKIHSGLSEGALAEVWQESIFPEPLEDDANMLEMGLLIWTGNENVVQVDKQRWDRRLPYPSDQSLETFTSFTEAIGHVQEPPQA
jgi:hypothetical protein